MAPPYSKLHCLLYLVDCAGFATTAARAGVSEQRIMRQGRWRTSQAMRGYIREGELFAGNPRPSWGCRAGHAAKALTADPVAGQIAPEADVAAAESRAAIEALAAARPHLLPA